MSSSRRPSSSAARKTTVSTPSWTSFSSSIREISRGPISETVARMGWPASPNRSQNTTGAAAGCSSRFIALARASIFSLGAPAAAIPQRSPLISAANTGTPASEKPWARVWRVTVLPVPVAPATKPWRLARSSRRLSG